MNSLQVIWGGVGGSLSSINHISTRRENYTARYLKSIHVLDSFTVVNNGTGRPRIFPLQPVQRYSLDLGSVWGECLVTLGVE